MHLCCKKSQVRSPEAEGRAPGEEDGLGFGFGLLEEAEECVVLHTDLPEDLAAVAAGHGELQRVVVGVLLEWVGQRKGGHLTEGHRVMEAGLEVGANLQLGRPSVL